jgi:hypothetical protein
MSGNIFVFWRPSADPPLPWTRLTRQGRYCRFTDSVAYHLAQVGASTHYHANTMSSVWIGNSNTSTNYSDGGVTLLGNHAQGSPSAWSISAVNNDPAWYGLDLIYMDLAVWESVEKRFPDGAIILSSEALTDAGFMERFTAADGKYIVNTVPETTGGVTENKQHYCTANTGTGKGAVNEQSSGRTGLASYTDHTHPAAAWSSANTNEPRNLTTRLYEILALTLMAKTGTVVFCDGVPGSNWEVQSGWTGANLKSGNSNPTLSGADSHGQSISGNTGAHNGQLGAASGSWEGSYNVAYAPIDHVHPFSATLATEDHIPVSSLLVPYKLKVELVHSAAQRGAQLIGLCG